VQPTSQPPDVIQIGIAIVFADGNVIIGTRGSDQHLADMNEFPGGKCELNESPEECATRECSEECGISVEVIKLLHREVFEYPDRTVDLSFYLCEPIKDDEAKQLSLPFQWVELNLLESLSFPEGNQQVLKLLKQLNTD
jgi:8-oxo-dGTP diphosphatase